MKLDTFALWRLYTEQGQSLVVIAGQIGTSYGSVRTALARHPDYLGLAGLRRTEGGNTLGNRMRKPVDEEAAMADLRQGHTLRQVSVAQKVSCRTLALRLEPRPEYLQMMVERRQSRRLPTR